MSARDDLDIELLPCPFCGGVPKFNRYQDRFGYGEYEKHIEYCSVSCQICGARGHKVRIPTFVEFVPSDIGGVQYWRDNPHKRAEWDDKHQAHIQTLVAEAKSKWNRRQT